MQSGNQRGFTLPELLVVTFVVCLFVAASIFLLRPVPLTKEMHDAKRWSDVAQLMQGINRYVAATGYLPASITDKTTAIGNGKGGSDLCKELLPTYIKQMPLDPTAGLDLSASSCADQDAVYASGYTIVKTNEHTVTISAPHAESTQKITITHTY